MKTDALHIILFDNQPLYLKGVMNSLHTEAGLQHITTCTTHEDFWLQLKQQPYHIVFLELNFGSQRYDGFSVCREIKELYPQLLVAVLSRYNAPHFIQFAAECGAGAYFDKYLGPEAISNFLHQFADGGVTDFYLQISAQATLPNNPLLFDEFELRYLLTRQECRVMKLIVAGKEHKQIEEELGISYDTFKSHHRNILSKLHVTNDVELTKFAIAYRLTNTDCSQLPAFLSKKLSFIQKPR